MIEYSLEQFEKDIESVKPRFFDTYVLPPFLVWYAYRSREMKKNIRRMLFTAGIYMFYRNYSNYKTAVLALEEKLAQAVEKKTV